MDAVEIHQRLAIQVNLEGVQPDGAELVGAAGGRREVARPANPEIVVVHILARRAVLPVKVDLRIHAREQRAYILGRVPDHLAGIRPSQLPLAMRLAVEIRDAEILGGQAVAAVRAVRGEQRRSGNHLEGRQVGGQAAAAHVHHAGAGHGFADSLERRHRLARVAVVIAKLHQRIVGVGSDDRDGLQILTQRQRGVFVLQQHDGAARYLERQLTMGGALVLAVRYLRVLHARGRIEHPQLEARQQEAAKGAVDIGLGDQALSHGRQEILILDAAVEVGAGLERAGDSMRGVGRGFVMEVGVAHGAAIRYHIALEPPLLPQNVLQQPGAGAGRLPVHAVIGAHHAPRPALPAQAR